MIFVCRASELNSAAIAALGQRLTKISQVAKLTNKFFIKGLLPAKATDTVMGINSNT